MHLKNVIGLRLSFTCFVAFFLTFNTVTNACRTCQYCNKKSTNFDKAPTFICQYNVTVFRSNICGVRIREIIVLPHTTGRSLYRSIPLMTSFQTVTNVRVKMSKPTNPRVRKGLVSSGYRVTIGTIAQKSPVVIQISYLLKNGVMQFSKSCNRYKPRPAKNVIRWRLGTWDKVVKFLSVSFKGNNKSKIQILGSNKSGRVVSKSYYNVNGVREVYAVESGTSLCSQKLQCFS